MRQLDALHILQTCVRVELEVQSVKWGMQQVIYTHVRRYYSRIITTLLRVLTKSNRKW